MKDGVFNEFCLTVAEIKDLTFKNGGTKREVVLVGDNVERKAAMGDADEDAKALFKLLVVGDKVEGAGQDITRSWPAGVSKKTGQPYKAGKATELIILSLSKVSGEGCPF